MISIFAKQAFLNVNPGSPYKHTGEKPKRGYLMRVSSMIRGDQIAERVGARYNPTEGYENDVCIYVKPHLKKGDLNFKFEGRKSYLDIIDGHNLGQLMINYPKVGVIVCSEVDKETMAKVIPNEIVVISQHHCNFDRLKRTRTEVKRVGVIGTRGAFDFLPKGLEEEINKRGMELVKFCDFFTRQDIINFYMSIDLQIVWRPYKKLLSNPLKIVNASSFGIPTVALQEKAFNEMQQCYVPVSDSEELLVALDELRSTSIYYDGFAQRCLKKAEYYHIDNIAELYKELDK